MTHSTLKKITILFCLLFVLSSCKKEPQIVSKVTATIIPIDSTQVANSKITQTIAPYKEKMIAEINTVISYTNQDLLTNDGELESTMGNLLADLSVARVNPLFNKKTGENIDFSLFNHGGIRTDIKKGAITNRHAFQLMPFENRYVVCELSGQQLLEMVTYLIKGQRAHPVSKEFRLLVTSTGFNLNIKNKPFDVNKTYFVLTTDFLQTGGDRMNFFKNPIKLYTLDYKMRTAIIDYFKSVDTVKSSLDGRFKKDSHE